MNFRCLTAGIDVAPISLSDWDGVYHFSWSLAEWNWFYWHSFSKFSDTEFLYTTGIDYIGTDACNSVIMNFFIHHSQIIDALVLLSLLFGSLIKINSWMFCEAIGHVRRVIFCHLSCRIFYSVEGFWWCCLDRFRLLRLL